MQDFYQNSGFQISTTEGEKIVQLRLLVARAAQTDSLHWWEDNSLTPEGDFVLGRLFARKPKLAGAKMALKSAKLRHQEAIPRSPDIATLFYLGDDLEHILDEISILESWIHDPPIPSKAAYLYLISSLVPNDLSIQVSDHIANGVCEIKLENNGNPASNPFLEASVLAIAYGEGDYKQPIFPFIRRKF